MEQDAVRLTTSFIKILQGHDSPEQFRGKSVVLGRLEDGLALALAEGRFNRRAYVTVIDIPEEYFNMEMLDFLFAMDALIAAKVYASMKAIKSSQHRSEAVKSRAGKLGAQTRWGKG